MSELHYLSAIEALELFKTRKLSPVELMSAIIARAEAVEPEVNALCLTTFDEAMDQAREAEARYMQGTERPLEGIPCAVKDEYYIAGRPTTNGSLLLQDYIPDETSPVAERLMNAGAIVHARTTTPEFSIAGYTWSKVWGVTRNPWNLAIGPGGSSGGSAAALASGTTTLVTGSDIAGSIRIPASFCGVVGYKAPYGRNPELPPFNLEYANHTGPLGRNVADTILMQNIISGPHPGDIATVKPKINIPSQFEEIKGWRIGYSLDLGYYDVDEAVRRNTLATLDLFRSLGATVEEVEVGWTRDVEEAYIHHLGYGPMGGFLGQFYQSEKRELMTNYAQVVAQALQGITPDQYVAAEMLAGEMYKTLGRIFEHYDLLICPTIACTGIPADLFQTSTIEEMLADPDHIQIGWAMTYPFNLLSRCPVLSVPSGYADNGVPTGIQLIAPTFEDAVVFQAAAAYEQANPGVFISEGNRPI